MQAIWANLLLPKAMKSCPKCNKSPNLGTLFPSYNVNYFHFQSASDDDNTSTVGGMSIISDLKTESVKVKQFKFIFFIRPFPASFFVFSTVNSRYFIYNILPMTGFELRTSNIGSDRFIQNHWPLNTYFKDREGLQLMQ